MTNIVDQTTIYKSLVKDYNLYKKLSKGLKPYLWVIVLAIISLIAAKAIEAGSLKFLVPKLPDLFKQAQTLQDSKLKLVPLMLFIAAILRSACGFSCKFFIGYLTKSYSKDLRGKILTHMLLIPIEFFKQNPSGNLISKVNYDVEQVSRALADSILELLSSIVTIFFFIGIMLSFSCHITFLALTIIPLIYWFLSQVNLRIRKYSTRLQQSVGNVSHLTHEIIEACQIIRIFAAIPQETKRIDNLIQDNFKQELKIVLASSLSESIMLLSLSSVFVLLIYIAISKSLAITTGEFVGLFGAMYGLIRPLKQLSQVNNVISRGIAAIDSIFNLLAIPPENYHTCQITDLFESYAKNLSNQTVSTKIDLTLKNVTFDYPNKKYNVIKKILDQINLNCYSGTTTAIVGRSGSGKSTLISLLPKFYQLTHGNIFLNNININDLDLVELRNHFAMVTQRIILLNDTIANNIAYGATQHATTEQIIKAATLANAMEFIEQLPQGLDTNIGNNGNLLSGGQRQRIAIARAILKDAPILILDEATSALDLESEGKIQAGLEKLTTNKTTIVISHRSSTIEKADQIIVLDEGKLVATGTHQELRLNSYYNTLYQSKSS